MKRQVGTRKFLIVVSSARSAQYIFNGIPSASKHEAVRRNGGPAAFPFRSETRDCAA